MKRTFKKACKILSVFLTMIFIIQVLPMSVWAKDLTDSQVRKAYFNSALSGYLKEIVDTKDALSIVEYDEINNNDSKAELNRTSVRGNSVQGISSMEDVSVGENTDTDDIDHNILTLSKANNENVAYSFSEPISFIDDDGSLVYKDTNIKENANKTIKNRGFDYENGPNDYKMYFSKNVKKGILLVPSNRNEISITPVNSASSEGKIETFTDDGKDYQAITYKKTFDNNTDIRYTPQLNGVKEEIIVNKYTGVTNYSFKLKTKNATAAINSYGAVEIIDKDSGEIVDTLAAPFAYDSSGGFDSTSEHYTDCTYSLENIKEGEYILTVSIPASYLTADSTVYPVVIDPSATSYVACDTAFYAGTPNTPQGSNHTANCGKSRTYGLGRAIFWFPMPGAISAYATISSAKLYVRETTGNTGTMWIRPLFVTSYWNETYTWTNRPYTTLTFSYPGTTNAYMAWKDINGASTDVSGSKFWYAFDLTHAARAWNTGTESQGVEFISYYEDTSSGYYWRAFATREHSTSSYRPYGVITYTNDTTAPVINSVSGNPTSWTNNNVTLTVSASDNGYGVRYYSFDNGTTWQTSNSKTFTYNTTVNIKVKDYAGNVSSVKSVVINKMDKVAPGATISLSPTESTHGKVTATINLTDNVALGSYRIDNDAQVSVSGKSKTVTKEYTENTTVSVTVTDAAGNTKTVSQNITNIVPESVDIDAAPSPDVYVENGYLNVLSRSFDFIEGTDSPEHLEYKLGSDGEWTEFTEPVKIINTEDVTVYARNRDEAGNISEVSSYLYKTDIGEFRKDFEDISVDDQILPPLFRRYYSTSDGWFFGFDSSVSAFTNGYVFRDLGGYEHYYILNKDGKYKSSAGDELTISNGITCVTAGKIDYRFNSSGKLTSVTDNTNNRVTTLGWSDTSILVTDSDGRTANVTLQSGKPTNITYTRSTANGGTRTSGYSWQGDNLASYTDSEGNSHSYTYNSNNLLTTIDSLETIEYISGLSGTYRLKRVSSANGSFVNFKYTDNEVSYSDPELYYYGKLYLKKSDGTTNVYNYSNGIDNVYSLTNIDSVGDIRFYGEIDNSYEIDQIAQVFYSVLDNDINIANTNEKNIYEQDQDGNYYFYDYSEDGKVLSKLYVPTGSMSVTPQTSFTDAENYATKKYTYSYTSAGNLETYAECVKIYTWRQTYGEEYQYNPYRKTTEKTVLMTSYSAIPNSAQYSSETKTKTTQYTYDEWNQCISENYDHDSPYEVNISISYDSFGRKISISSGDEISTYEYDTLGRIIKLTSPEGITSYTYLNGNLSNLSYPNGTNYAYIYDEYGNLITSTHDEYIYEYNTLGSVLSVKVGETLLATYSYSNDLSQNLLTANYANGYALVYEYNISGDILKVIQNNTILYNYDYIQLGDDKIPNTSLIDVYSDLNKYIEVDKTTVKRNDDVLYIVESHKKGNVDSSDFNGTLNTIGNNSYKVENVGNTDCFSKNEAVLFSKLIDKDVNGNVTSTSVNSSFTTNYGYNSNNNVTQVQNLLNNYGLTYGYSYNSSGKLISETFTRQGRGSQGETQVTTNNTAYTYDSKGQLTSVENNDTKWEYTYDVRGNILTKKEYTVSTADDGTKTYTLKENGASTFGYDTVWADKLTTFNGQTITYDDVGNPLTYRGNTLTWTFGRRLASFGNITYTYNEDGIRTKKMTEDSTTEFYLDGSNIIRQSDGTDTLYFFYDRDDNLTGFEYDGAVYFYVKNMQGDIVAISDDSGNVVAEYTYDPWGKVLSVTGTNSALGNLNPFRYRGYYYDTDTNLYYLQSRYYDPETGRFLNADEYHSAKQSTKRDNVYAYCMNNPIMYSDKDGREAVALGSGVYVASAISSLFVPGIGWVLLEGLLVGLCVVGVIVLAGMVVNIIYEAATSKKEKTKILSDVKSKCPNREKVYQMAYVDECGVLKKHHYKMDYFEALASLNCLSAINNLRRPKRYVRGTETDVKNYAKSTHYGIYTFSQRHARYLAESIGIGGAPEVHKSGQYGHYHDHTHTFHIWFGGIITF